MLPIKSQIYPLTTVVLVQRLVGPNLPRNRPPGRLIGSGPTAVLVDGEAVHHDLLERRLSPQSDAGQERGVEPSGELRLKSN